MTARVPDLKQRSVASSVAPQVLVEEVQQGRQVDDVAFGVDVEHDVLGPAQVLVGGADFFQPGPGT
jgi:hypothetical protein